MAVRWIRETRRFHSHHTNETLLELQVEQVSALGLRFLIVLYLLVLVVRVEAVLNRLLSRGAKQNHLSAKSIYETNKKRRSQFPTIITGNFQSLPFVQRPLYLLCP